MKSSLVAPVIVGLMIMSSGCNRPPDPPPAFEPNLVHTAKYQVAQGIEMDQASHDSYWITDKMFGTPNEPKLPDCITSDEDLADVVSMDHLHRASGAATEPDRGLYAQHCVKCHGVTGNGRGEIAAVQNPYPRDYRPGIFKFKTTPRGSKPTKENLTQLIRHGIGGTAMEPLPNLSDDDIAALVDYVIFLSIRGEVERQLVDGAMLDGIIEDGGRILNTELAARIDADPTLIERWKEAADSDDELDEATQAEVDAYEMYDENWSYAQDYAIEIVESWLDAEDDVVDEPEPPADLPLAESYADVVRLRGGEDAAAFNQSVHRGQQLYAGKIASCSKCHGLEGLGNGQITDFDDWTKDWTTRVALDPTKRDPLIPLLARGAMEPKPIIPRNFTEGIFRGGKSSSDLYRRIMQGVDGTPMPAATFVEGQFEADGVWDLINYIRTLEQPPADATARGIPRSP